jgi:hypothetical protein
MGGALSIRGKAMTRDFNTERFKRRVAELRDRHEDTATFMVETARLMVRTAKSERERRDAEAFLKTMVTARKFGVLGGS